jgi:hypothetical protein
MTVPTYEFNPSGDFDRYSYTRTRLMEECNVRRTRQWKVFAWASNLLIAFMGVVITLYSTKNPLSIHHAIFVALVAVLIGMLGSVWIRHDAKMATFYSESCLHLDRVFGLKIDEYKHRIPHRSHIIFLFLLSLLTCFVASFATA